MLTSRPSWRLDIFTKKWTVSKWNPFRDWPILNANCKADLEMRGPILSRAIAAVSMGLVKLCPDKNVLGTTAQAATIGIDET
jgi:hypothetical protein